MVTPVTVPMYRASDGSLHDTESGARFRDESNAKQSYQFKIAGVVYGGFMDALRWHDKPWSKMDEWQRTAVLEDLTKVLIEKREELSRALTGGAK